jgi:ABC-type multidrug transport system ATPase subunit
VSFPEADGKIIVLLGPHGSGKTRALLSAFGVAFSPICEEIQRYVDREESRIGLCPAQDLLESHLTGRENMQLVNGLSGRIDQGRIDELLERSQLEEYRNGPRAYELPLPARRTFELLIALLPDPDVLLIDDLTRGMSLSASRKLLQFLRSEQTIHPRTVFFATGELEVAQTLGDEIWWIHEGRVKARWEKGYLPHLLQSTSCFLLELKSSQAAREFYEEVRKAASIHDCQLKDRKSVVVYVKDFQDLVTLTWKAGPRLERFSTMAIDMDGLCELFPDFELGYSPSVIQTPAESLECQRSEQRQENQTTKTLKDYREIQPMLSFAQSEWRRHFRGFWKFFNVIFTLLYSLVMLEIVVQKGIDLGSFVHFAYGFLMMVTVFIPGLGMEGVSRLVGRGQMSTLFQKPELVDARHPLSPLLFYERMGGKRGQIFMGLMLGQFCIHLAHSLSMLLYIYLVWVKFPNAPWLAAASLGIWVMMTITSQALTICLGIKFRRSGWAKWLGWCVSLILFLTGLLLPVNLPLLWLWPYTGFRAAFERLALGAFAVVPFCMAIVGLLGLVLGSVWLVKRYSIQKAS